MLTRHARRTALLATAILTTGAALMSTAGPASAHTPAATIDCATWSISATNYETGDLNTYSVSIDGGTPATGQFGAAFSSSGTFATGTGDHTLVGYVHTSNANPAYSHDYSLATSGCTTFVPVPAAPAVTAPTCDTDGTLTVAAPGDHVAVTQTPDGTGPGSYHIVYAAEENYAFPDGNVLEYFDVSVLGKTGDCQTTPPTSTPPSSKPPVSKPPVTHKPVAHRPATHPVVITTPPTAPATPPLANTGPHTGRYVLAGAGLVAVGIAALLLGVFGWRRNGSHR